MAPRLSKSLLGIERQKKLQYFTILNRKLRNHVRILIVSNVVYLLVGMFHSIYLIYTEG